MHHLNIRGIHPNTLLQLFTINGALVYESILDQDKILDISEYTPGTYIIKVKDLDSGMQGVSKFIKIE